MRVLMIVYRAMSQPIGNRTGNVALALSESGYEVDAIKFDWGGTYPKTQKLDGIDVKNIKLPDFGGTLKQLLTLPTGYDKLRDEISEKEFDIVYCQQPFLLPFALHLKRDRSCKVVYDAYEMYSIDASRHFPDFLSGPIRRLFEFFENRLVDKTNCVLTVDSYSGFLKRRYKNSINNVEVLYNVPKLDVSPDKSKTEELKKEYEGEKILIHVGGIAKNRGLMQALEAINSLKHQNVKLLMVGKFKDSKKEALEYIKKNGLNDKVEFVEWLPHKEMLSYLKIADIALALYQPVGHQEYTSTGNSRKIFTYMQASLPIVGPEFKEKGQAIREENCGVLVDTTDPEDIAEGIEYLSEHPEEARAMGERGRKAIEERYNWESEKEKLLRAFERLEESP